MSIPPVQLPPGFRKRLGGEGGGWGGEVAGRQVGTDTQDRDRDRDREEGQRDTRVETVEKIDSKPSHSREKNAKIDGDHALLLERRLERHSIAVPQRRAPSLHAKFITQT